MKQILEKKSTVQKKQGRKITFRDFQEAWHLFLINLVYTNRVCPLCKSGIEDELHVILECPEYDVARRELFDKLLVDIDGILCYSKKEILKIILNCDNQFLVKVCARACYNFLSIRRKMLCQP